jgi:hypothetical protein
MGRESGGTSGEKMEKLGSGEWGETWGNLKFIDGRRGEA